MINYERIKEVNGLLKTIPLSTKKGKKDYVPVNEQVKGFRMLYPAGTIKTELSFINDKTVMFIATVYDENGSVLATGTAYEVEGSNFINATSYIENCETSAVGRALSFCGIGIDQSIASMEETVNAMLNQDKTSKPAGNDSQKLMKELLVAGAKKGYTKDDIKGFCHVDDLTTLSDERIQAGIDYIGTLDAKGEYL